MAIHKANKKNKKLACAHKNKTTLHFGQGSASSTTVNCLDCGESLDTKWASRYPNEK